MDDETYSFRMPQRFNNTGNSLENATNLLTLLQTSLCGPATHEIDDEIRTNHFPHVLIVA